MATLLDNKQVDSTSNGVTVRIIDDPDGTPELGVVFNTAGIAFWYRREGGVKVAITITDLTTPDLGDPWQDGGFLHISDSEYRLDVPDAAFVTGAAHVDIGGTVTGMVVIGGRVALVGYNPEDGLRLGLTALPGAAADAAGGLPISDDGGLDMDAMAAKIAAIGNSIVTVVSPVAQDQRVEIIRGDDYKVADARELSFVNASGSWPDLTGATVTFTANHRTVPASTFTTPGQVITPNGANQKMIVEIDKTKTLGLDIGFYDYDLEITLASLRVCTLVLSELKMLEDQTI